MVLVSSSNLLQINHTIIKSGNVHSAIVAAFPFVYYFLKSCFSLGNFNCIRSDVNFNSTKYLIFKREKPQMHFYFNDIIQTWLKLVEVKKQWHLIILCLYEVYINKSKWDGIVCLFETVYKVCTLCIWYSQQ
jgi:hypothetical protein